MTRLLLRLFLFFNFFFISMALHSHEIFLYPFFEQKISFSQLKGRWVFINYWASWCGPCVHEIGALNCFYKKNKNKIALFGVNYDHLSQQKQRLLIKEYNLEYPSLRKDPAEQLELGDIVGVPVTFIFNPQGVLVNKLYGGQNCNGLNKLLAKLT